MQKHSFRRVKAALLQRESYALSSEKTKKGVTKG